MMNRRVLIGAASLPLLAGACTNGQIDPQKVLDLLATVCHIAVPVATVTAIINASVGATVQSIVDLICTGYQTTVSEQRKLGKTLGANEPVEYDVVVNGKKIHVVATPK